MPLAADRASIRPKLASDLWVVALTAVLGWPLLVNGGYPLSRDMVFTPALPLSGASIGLGDSLPRAVPLDAVVGLLSHLIGGAATARVLVLGFLLLAGWGAHRVLPNASPVAAVAVAGLAIWNPFVAERLALGHWALLSSYAALWWLIAAVPRYLQSPRGLRDLPPVVAWTAVASLTPSGGCIAILLLAALCVRSGFAARARVVLVSAVLLQLPWLLPAFASNAQLGSDPAGIAAFSMRTESFGGVLVTALGLGGIWDATSMPPSRAGLLAVLMAATVALCLVLGLRGLLTRLGATGARVAVIGVVGLLLALSSRVPGVDAALRWFVSDIPGGGIVRDAHKWLMLFVVLAVLCVGVTVERVVTRWRLVGSRALSAIVVVACVPIILLPDAAQSVWRTVSPVQYPADFAAVHKILHEHPDGDVVVLPWRSYRVFTWGTASSVYDPASRWFGDRVIGSETLQVGAVAVAGEDSHAARIGDIVTADGPLDLKALRRLGTELLLIYQDDPMSAKISRDQMTPMYEGKYLALYDIGSATGVAPERLSPSQRLLVALDIVILSGAMVAMALTAGRRLRRLIAQSA